jgi:hypothetical protein
MLQITDQEAHIFAHFLLRAFYEARDSLTIVQYNNLIKMTLRMRENGFYVHDFDYSTLQLVMEEVDENHENTEKTAP